MFFTDVDIQRYLQGRTVIFVFEPQRRQFYLEAIKQIMEICVTQNTSFKCLLIFRKHKFSFITRKTRIRSEVELNTMKKILEMSQNVSHLEVSYVNAWRKIFQFPMKFTALETFFSLLKNQHLKQSILSVAKSRQYIPEWMDKLPKRRLIYLKCKSFLEWQSAYQSTQDFISDLDNPLVVILNGRLPSQAAIRELCERTGLDMLFLEQGIPKNKNFFLQAFQTQESAQLRSFNEARKARISESKQEYARCIQLGEAWIKRQGGKEQNKFAIWEHEDNDLDNLFINKLDNNQPIASFFNSSLEERESNLGMEKNGWQNQSHAFDAAIKKCVSEGYRCIFRIHPNYRRKNLRSLLRILNVIYSNKVEFILPWHKDSSSSLLTHSNIVVTWGSTVSLESTYQCIPTFLLGRTTVDSIIDVNIVQNVENSIETMLAQPNHPNSSNSAFAAYLNRNLGIEMKRPELAANLLYEKRRSDSRLRRRAITSLLFRGWNSTPDDIFIILRPFFGQNLAESILERFLKLLLFMKVR